MVKAPVYCHIKKMNIQLHQLLFNIALKVLTVHRDQKSAHQTTRGTKRKAIHGGCPGASQDVQPGSDCRTSVFGEGPNILPNEENQHPPPPINIQYPGEASQHKRQRRSARFKFFGEYNNLSQTTSPQQYVRQPQKKGQSDEGPSDSGNAVTIPRLECFDARCRGFGFVNYDIDVSANAAMRVMCGTLGDAEHSYE